MRARILAGIFTAIFLGFAGMAPIAAATLRPLSYSGASCYSDANGYERCYRSYEIPPNATALGAGRISGKVSAKVDFPKSIGYRGMTYLSGSATGYTTNVCASPQFSARHEFKVNGATGSVSWQGAGVNVGGTNNSTGAIVVASRNQNWNLSFRADYPASVTHNYTISVTCGGQTAISGGSEEIPLYS
ncbi:hypothetical protein [Lentzea sp. NPDC055074]